MRTLEKFLTLKTEEAISSETLVTIYYLQGITFQKT